MLYKWSLNNIKNNIKYKIQYYLTFTELVCKLMHSSELRECCPQCFLLKKEKKGKDEKSETQE